MGKQFATFLMCIYCLSVFSQTRNTLIAKERNGKYTYAMDTIAIKNIFDANVKESLYMADSCQFSMALFDEVSIEKKTISKNKEQYYYLLLRNYELHLKAACLLTKVNDDLVLFYYDKDLQHQDLMLNMSYIVCYGTDSECFPQLNISSTGRKYWTSKSPTILYCDPDDPCKTSVSLILDLTKPAE